MVAAVRASPLAEGLAVLLRGLGDWCAPAAPHDDISILAVQFDGRDGLG
jgi:hypothetical protein